MLRCRGITVRFGGLVALEDLDFEMPDRGVSMLVGPNGAGKTTFINVLTRIYTPERGTMELDGVDLLRLSADKIIRAGIARSFQKAELFGGMTARENVLVGLQDRISLFPSPRRAELAAREKAHAILREIGLAHVADVTASSLSYGYQKMLDVARALASEPRLLLLDEPFAGVTHAEIPTLIACIAQVAKERAVLMVEHHLELVMDLAERVTVLDFGRKIAEGTPAEIRRDPAVIRSYLGTRGHAC